VRFAFWRRNHTQDGLRPLTLVSGRHPIAVLMLVWSVIAGVLYLFGSPPPASITQSLPATVVYAWYALLTIGSTVALIGVFGRAAPLERLVTSLLIERLGLTPLGVGALVWAIAIFAVGGTRGLGSGGLTAAYGAACLIRTLQITRYLRRIRTARVEGQVVPLLVLGERPPP